MDYMNSAILAIVVCRIDIVEMGNKKQIVSYY
ncbi:hypothetical protein NIES4103_62240 [Nostoc sp. NIES-4103]|nr:hypothetical protein NIES4103_62240 [Nostoc sp. NIES-4103]